MLSEVPGPRAGIYGPLGHRKELEYDIGTRECLYCGSRQRKIAKLGPHVNLGNGMSTRNIVDMVIIDLGFHPQINFNCMETQRKLMGSGWAARLF